VVPMFHVNAWGVPYIAAMVGCKLVLPGPGMDGESLAKLITNEKVTIALGVPTIWLGLLAAFEATGLKPDTLKRTVVGGSALPPFMIAEFRDKYDVELIHAWGMTETSPLGTVNQLLQKHTTLSKDAQAQQRLGQGRPPWGVELRIVDENGALLPNDGETMGEVMFQGNIVMKGYLKNEEATKDSLAGGWFHSGDLGVVHADGYLQLKDRSKDVIISGGENISSIEVEEVLYVEGQRLVEVDSSRAGLHRFVNAQLDGIGAEARDHRREHGVRDGEMAEQERTVRRIGDPDEGQRPAADHRR